MRNSTPSRLRICATAAATFMMHSFFLAAGLRRGDYSRMTPPAATHPRICHGTQPSLVLENEPPMVGMVKHRDHREHKGHREEYMERIPLCALCADDSHLVS